MIVGAHSIIYSKDADADRAFLRDVLGFPNVDVGEGWLIFGLPPSECAVHPGPANDEHEFYLMCDDVQAFVAEMGAHGAVCAPVQDRGYGLITAVALPGGGKLGVYEPRHARPEPMPAGGKGRAARAGGRPQAQAKAQKGAKANGKQAKAAAMPKRPPSKPARKPAGMAAKAGKAAKTGKARKAAKTAKKPSRRRS